MKQQAEPRRLPVELWLIFGVLLVLFSLLVLFITMAGIDEGPDHDRQVLVTTFLAVTGPFVGAIARDMSSCCLEFSLLISAFCAPLLLIGIAVQFLGRASGPRGYRLLLWTLGWFAWFLGGLMSFGHALS